MEQGDENVMKKKYCVNIMRSGYIFVEANSAGEAMDIADHQMTGTVNWSDDWYPTDCDEVDGNGYAFVTERAF